MPLQMLFFFIKIYISLILWLYTELKVLTEYRLPDTSSFLDLELFVYANALEIVQISWNSLFLNLRAASGHLNFKKYSSNAF